MNDLKQALIEFIADQTGQPVEITLLEPLAGGGSRDTWRIDASVGDDAMQLVLRRDLETSMFEEALSRKDEFHALQAAYEAGVRVPRPRWHGDDLQGKPFFLMDFVDGVSIGRVIVKRPEFEPARAVLPQLMAEQLAKIHAIALTQVDFLPTSDSAPAEAALLQARTIVQKLDLQNPTLEFGLRWLEQHMPNSDRLTLVHGDFRLGNFQVGYPHGLNAVIDWEFTHIGDPLEDIAWPCVRDWRFGFGHLQLAGISQREPFIAAYEQLAGVTVDRKAVDYWEIMGNLRWAVICLAQADRHLSGHDPSVEFASLGRRSAEMQLEMLRLIQGY